MRGGVAELTGYSGLSYPLSLTRYLPGLSESLDSFPTWVTQFKPYVGDLFPQMFGAELLQSTVQGDSSG